MSEMSDAIDIDAPSKAQRIADVVTFPARTARDQAERAAVQVQSWSATHVDDWGRDNGFVNRVWAASRLRWSISVGGAHHLPARAGALVIVNTRRFALAPVFAALSIGDATGRPVRFVGRPDTAPLGPLMQRLGALLPIEGELIGALNAGEVIVVGAAPELTNVRCGLIDHRLVGAAIAAKVRVYPAVTISVAGRRQARVDVGPAVQSPRQRRGPLSELELADATRDELDRMLNELGGTATGTPLDWIPTIGIGGR
mgnify:CR=1 FL=1